MPRKPVSVSDIAEPHRTDILKQLHLRQVKKASFSKTIDVSQPKKKRRGVMNGHETEWLGVLQYRGVTKASFEAITLTLAAGSRYTPDFYVPALECRSTFYEVKGGFIREAAMVRLKVAARVYPEFQFILAQKRDGKWTETEIAP